jgi:hypothetical protein
MSWPSCSRITRSCLRPARCTEQLDMSRPTQAGSHMTGMIEAAVFPVLLCAAFAATATFSIRCCRARATYAPWGNFAGTVWVNREAQRGYRLRCFGGR